MIISGKEEQLVAAFRKLPPEAAEQLSNLRGRLAELTPGSGIDWSEEWSEQDLQDYTAASAARIEADEAQERTR